MACYGMVDTDDHKFIQAQINTVSCLSSSVSSRTHAYANEPLPAFRESCSNLCIAFLPTNPSWYNRWPIKVLLPASTCPEDVQTHISERVRVNVPTCIYACRRNSVITFCTEKKQDCWGYHKVKSLRQCLAISIEYNMTDGQMDALRHHVVHQVVQTGHLGV